jgi:hypothetical protein
MVSSKMYGRNYKIRNNASTMLLSIGILPHLTPTHIALATIYFNPSVGDHEGANVASGPVCWS